MPTDRTPAEGGVFPCVALTPANAITPGPWFVAPQKTHFTIQRRLGADGYGDTLAEVVYWSRPAPHQPSREQAEANARAIAAVPDLIDAAEALDAWAIANGLTTSSYCEFCDSHAPKDEPGNITGPVLHDDDCPLALARAALARARGEC